MEDSQMKIREAKEESQIKESAKQIRDKKQDALGINFRNLGMLANMKNRSFIYR